VGQKITSTLPNTSDNWKWPAISRKIGFSTWRCLRRRCRQRSNYSITRGS
jgi:hypothetical protein